MSENREQVEACLGDIDQIAARINKPPFRKMMQNIRGQVARIRELLKEDGPDDPIQSQIPDFIPTRETPGLRFGRRHTESVAEGDEEE
jgi:hypothetical protein